MAKFPNSSGLSAPNVDFTQVQARERPDVRAEQLSTAVKGATIAGKAFAKRSGAEVAGANVSLREANTQAKEIDREINALISGPVQPGSEKLNDTRVKELKDEALSKYAQNDRVLLALRDQGTISTSEARARRIINLQNELSNPINALFKGDFLDAAQDLTGGSSGAVNGLFPFTKEELQQQAIESEESKAVAEEAGIKAGLVASSGLSDEVITDQIQKQKQSELRLKEFNRIKQQRSLNGEEFSQQNSLLQDGATRRLTLKMNQLNNANGGDGVPSREFSGLTREIDQQYQAMLSDIKRDVTTAGPLDIGRDQRLELIEDLDQWKLGMEASLKTFDSESIKDKDLKATKQIIEQVGYELMPRVMFLKSIDPPLAKDFLISPASFKGFFGKNTASTLDTVASRIKAATNFVQGKPPIGVDIAGMMVSTITANGTKPGLDYVTSDSVQNDPAKKLNLAKMYYEAPAKTLQSYNTLDAQVMAPKSPRLRIEVDKAMGFARDKMNEIKKRIGASSEVIFAEPKAIKNTGPFGRRGDIAVDFPGKNPEWILNLPDGMQENAQDLKAMYKMVLKNPWMWENVKEEYLDGSDAFNGYMRGEWDVNVNMEPSPSGAVSNKKDTTGAPVSRSKPIPITKGDTLSPEELSGLQGKQGVPARFIPESPKPDDVTFQKGPYRSAPESSGAYNLNEFILWSEAYNVEGKTPAENKRDAERVSKILNEPTPEQSENIARIAETIDFIAPEAFKEEIENSGVTMEELKSLLNLTYAAETNAGTSKSQVSTSGALGAMQILPSTALSLMTKGAKPFGEEAALRTGFNRQAFIDGSSEKRKQMLLTNEQANILFAIAKYFEQIKRTKPVVNK